MKFRASSFQVTSSFSLDEKSRLSVLSQDLSGAWSSSGGRSHWVIATFHPKEVRLMVSVSDFRVWPRSNTMGR